MTVRFSLEAQQHISAIHRYIYVRNATAAVAVAARIRYTAELLGEFPLLGHEGTDPGTMELTVRGLPYIIVYEIQKRKREVVVLAVFHGAQER